MLHSGHMRAQHRRTDHVQCDCEQREKKCDSASCHSNVLSDGRSLRGAAPKIKLAFGLVVGKRRNRERICNIHLSYELHHHSAET